MAHEREPTLAELIHETDRIRQELRELLNRREELGGKMKQGTGPKDQSVLGQCEQSAAR